jgi:hypothetical protein
VLVASPNPGEAKTQHRIRDGRPVICGVMPQPH